MGWDSGLAVGICVAAIGTYWLIVSVWRAAIPAKMLKSRLKRIRQMGEGEKREKKRVFSSICRELLHMLLRMIASMIPVRAAGRKQLMRRISMCRLNLKPEEFMAVYLLAVSVGITFGIYMGLVFGEMMMFVAAGAAGGPLLLQIKFNERARVKRDEIQQQFPEILDLLRIAVEAGQGFGQAVQSVVEQCSGGLIDELALAQHAMTMGATRKTAFKELAERCDVDDIRDFTASITQSEELGIPVKTILEVQSQESREAMWNRVEVKIQKIPVKMIFPMTVFIFPATFLVILAPIVLRSWETFKGM